MASLVRADVPGRLTPELDEEILQIILGRSRTGQVGTKGNAAYMDLRRAIVTHEFPEMEPLEESWLLTMFDYGRTPLREGLLRLAHEKVVTWLPRQAPVIRNSAIEQLPKLYETRLMIEPEIAALAANRSTAADQDRLRHVLELLNVVSKAGNTYASVEMDFGLHTAIARATQNPYLRELSDSINLQSLRLWYRAHLHLGVGKVDEFHRQLVDAICAGDAEAARELAVIHVERFRDRQREILG